MCEDQYYYVGETTQLFTRLRKHENLNGGVNTETLIPITIVGLYRVDSICKFIEYRDYIKSKKNPQRVNYYLENFENSFEYDSKYDNLLAEQFVTERLMISAEENWEKIRGGKYTRFDIDYDFPEDELFTIDLPICNCGCLVIFEKRKVTIVCILGALKKICGMNCSIYLKRHMNPVIFIKNIKMMKL